MFMIVIKSFFTLYLQNLTLDVQHFFLNLALTCQDG